MLSVPRHLPLELSYHFLRKESMHLLCTFSIIVCCVCVCVCVCVWAKLFLQFTSLKINETAYRSSVWGLSIACDHNLYCKVLDYKLELKAIMELNLGGEGSLFLSNERDLNYCSQKEDCGQFSKMALAIFMVPHTHS